MSKNRKVNSSNDGSTFDILRARLDVEVARPAVIALTSAGEADGQEIAARQLGISLATAGYRALFVDTSLKRQKSPTPPGVTFEEIARQQIALASVRVSKSLASLTLNDPTLQRSTSKRGVESALDVLRSLFDFIIISTDSRHPSSFATALMASADAVVVTVSAGRRQIPDDRRLSAVLAELGSRFLGVVALDPSICNGSSTIPESGLGDELPRAHLDPERQRRTALKPST